MIRMYDLISFVSRGKSRKKVLAKLVKPLTPTQLAEKIGLHRSTTSRTLIELETKGLVKCITPNEKMGRFYEITENGKKVLNSIEAD
jgi:DNA-binding MarR family transcriptional regulator